MTRKRILLLLLGAVIFGALMFGISIDVNHYLESKSFCGGTCHTMIPERVAHARSPHANVDCGECHIGPGIKGFIRAKFVDGVREMFKVWTSQYARPIPSPIRHRLPVREMCEKCHWPDKFYGDRVVELTRFESDIPNTRNTLDLVVKTGGGRDEQGHGRGIHWHIMNQVEFGYRDQQRQDIPWVKVTRPSGEKLFLGQGEDPSVVGRTESHTMDCLDCHNRATHNLDPPVKRVDRELALGRIDPGLPEIRRLALEQFQATWPEEEHELSLEAVGAKVKAALLAYYTEKRPGVAQEKAQAIEQAAGLIAAIVVSSNFPYMKADWKTHANNLGHVYFRGCFRCHDGQHRTAGDAPEVIPQRCNTCHNVLGEMAENEKGQLEAQPFRILGETHQGEDCTTCHTVGQQQEVAHDARPLRAACLACHQDDKGGKIPAGFVDGAPHGGLRCFECHSIHFKAPPPEARCGRCHEAMDKRGKHGVHLKEGLTCEACHLPHAFRVDPSAVGPKCIECHGDLDITGAVKDFLK
jgi:hypothetical protein